MNATPELSGIDRAVIAAGGRRPLAAKLDVTEQAIAQWVARGWVPQERAVEIEEMFGVPRRTLLKPSLVALLDPDQ